MLRNIFRRLKRPQGGVPGHELVLPDQSELSGAFAYAMLNDLIDERRSERRWKKIKRSIFFIFLIMGIGSYVVSWMLITGTQIPFFSTKNTNFLGVIKVEGPIAAGNQASADKLIPFIREAFDSEQVKAIVLEIDSPGGSPVEADRVRQFIKDAQARNPKPVHAVIDNVGASAAYMIAIAADHIYASRYSLVGSVGAMMSNWDLHRAMSRHGVGRNTFASGELKTMLDPFHEPSEQAQHKAQSMVDAIGALFVEDVRLARGDKLMVDAAQLSSGEVWNGMEAAELGLIDGIGSLETIQAEMSDAQIKRYGGDGLLGISKAVSRWSAEIAETVVDVMTENAQRIRIH
jgi:protease-4